MDIILGSASPRRKEILSFFSLPFRQISSDFDENSIPFSGNPVHYASVLAKEKAKALIKKYPQSTIITADTVVCIDGKSLGKPESEQETYSMLKMLQGQMHSVYTALTVAQSNLLFCDVEETKVFCNELSDAHIKQYAHVHTLHDKAGSYAIQKSGALLVKKIDGCFYNVCGLPINLLRTLLFQVNIDLWDYIKDFD